jgi:hypothetical protein
MANTPLWSFRIPADLRERVLRQAKERGDSATDLVIQAFLEYVGDAVATMRPTEARPIGDPFMPPHPGPGRA